MQPDFIIKPDFWVNHDALILLCLTFFPRLTLLLGSFLSGGLLWWIGWVVAPHLLVAFLSLPYWDSNPLLVAAAWFLALIGTSVEVKTTSRYV